jgi:hypothetical protein
MSEYPPDPDPITWLARMRASASATVRQMLEEEVAQHGLEATWRRRHLLESQAEYIDSLLGNLAATGK